MTKRVPKPVAYLVAVVLAVAFPYLMYSVDRCNDALGTMQYYSEAACKSQPARYSITSVKGERRCVTRQDAAMWADVSLQAQAAFATVALTVIVPALLFKTLNLSGEDIQRLAQQDPATMTPMLWRSFKRKNVYGALFLIVGFAFLGSWIAGEVGAPDWVCALIITSAIVAWLVVFVKSKLLLTLFKDS